MDEESILRDLSNTCCVFDMKGLCVVIDRGVMSLPSRSMLGEGRDLEFEMVSAVATSLRAAANIAA